MKPEALVVHSDPASLRFACEALTMFRPGFRVATATDLPSASEWLQATDPEIVVWDPEMAPTGDIVTWWDDNHLDRKPTIALGACPEGVPEASAILATSTAAPAFMEAVRSVIGAGSERGLVRQNQGDQQA